MFLVKQDTKIMKKRTRETRKHHHKHNIIKRVSAKLYDKITRTRLLFVQVSIENSAARGGKGEKDTDDSLSMEFIKNNQDLLLGSSSSSSSSLPSMQLLLLL